MNEKLVLASSGLRSFQHSAPAALRLAQGRQAGRRREVFSAKIPLKITPFALCEQLFFSENSKQITTVKARYSLFWE